MTHKTKLLYVLLFTILGLNVNARTGKQKKDQRAFWAFPAAGGPWLQCRIQFMFITRFIFDFSQGVGLTFSGNATPVSLEKQGVEMHMPWTTGFGIGYRFTNWINLRVEPKWHRFEFNYENGQQKTSNEIISYNTVTVGLGLYGCYLPFKKKTNA